MKNESAKQALVIAGAILFNKIFWNEKLGVNALLFSAFITGSVFYLYPHSKKNVTCLLLFAAHLITLAMVIYQNTFFSKISFSITMLLFVVFSQYRHRSAWYAGGSVILNYVFAIPNFFKQVKISNGRNIKISGITKPIRMLLLPLLIVTVFIIIYSLANAAFSNIAANLADAVKNWFIYFFDWFSIQRFWFFILGFFITAGMIIAIRKNQLSDADMERHDDLLRKKNNFKKWKQSSFSDLLLVLTGKSSSGILALKNELTVGLISLVLLNLLLLFINAIDIKYVWLNFKFSNDINMVDYVHEGAGLLILSIVLAMLLLLFFFRGNLNFYKKNKWLKYGAYLWIFQNLILVASVFIRDYYYISHFGLAYRRIGLLFFLAMVMMGLITVFIKISFTKTTYYLLRLNVWAAIILLVFSSTINWDETIAGYNLARKTTIPLDVPFLLSLSDKTLPLIEKNKDVLANILLKDPLRLSFLKIEKSNFLKSSNTIPGFHGMLQICMLKRNWSQLHRLHC